MKHFTLLLVLLALITSCKPKEEPPPPEGKIPALEIKTLHEWPLPSGLVLIASQPGPEAFAALPANGIRTVINLRGPEELLFDEAQLATENNLNYIQIPVRPSMLTREQAREFARQFADKEAYPILVHCGSGGRAAMMMAIGEMQLYGTSVDAVISKARERGMTRVDLEKTVQAMGGDQ